MKITFLSLHAERYENVKNAIAKGEIDMPIIILSNDGLPYVDDGRHPIVALQKFGVSSLEKMVPSDRRYHKAVLLIKLTFICYNLIAKRFG